MATPTAALLSPAELATLGGAVTAVYFVTQGLRHAFGWNPRYVGLFSAIVLACYAPCHVSDYSLSAWVTVVPNAFIIYATASGVAAMSSAASRTRGRRQISENHGPEEMKYRTSFWSGWFY